MFDAPLLQDHIWSNLIKFNTITFTARLWVPWLLVVATVLALCVWILRKQLRSSPAYFNLFEDINYKFRARKKRDWAALSALCVALGITACYMFTTDNSFFENFDLMSLGTIRSLKFGQISNFDYTRITPLSFWYLSTVYAITQNMIVIKGFVFIQLLVAVWTMYCFFNYIPSARRLVFLAVFVLTPTVLLTSKVVFPERDVIILIMLSLICMRHFSKSSSLTLLSGFLFFMNAAIYTKETSILLYFGILLTSVLYNIWNEQIRPQSFLHPLQLIKSMPVEFLIGMSLLLYAIIHFLLQTPNDENLYLSTNTYSWQMLIYYYKFESTIALAALGMLIARAVRNYNTAANPMFRGGLVIGGVCVAVTIIFILQTAPNSPHLAEKTYYLQLPLLFSLAYIFQNTRSRLILAVLSLALLIYSAGEIIKARQKEIGIYYREVAEFMATKLPKGNDRTKAAGIFIIDATQADATIDKWLIEAWSSSYAYYLPEYNIVFKSDKHIPTDIKGILALRPFTIKAIYFPILPRKKPENGDWVIINKNNRLPKTLEIMKQLPEQPEYENFLFKVYRAK